MNCRIVLLPEGGDLHAPAEALIREYADIYGELRIHAADFPRSRILAGERRIGDTEWVRFIWRRGDQ